MTPEQKIASLSRSPEIQKATKLLIGLMENIGARNYVEMDFVLSAPSVGTFGNDTFRLSLKRNPVSEIKRERKAETFLSQVNFW